jgi:NAD-dependent SIR2 family protein deacetylase
MLFRMAKTMENMDSMEQNMRTMSAQMASLPAIVVELNQINAKMSVITHNLDSTLGRAGRMMPWMPFGP